MNFHSLTEADLARNSWSAAVEVVVERELALTLDELIDSLNPRQRTALCARYGLRGTPPVKVVAGQWRQTRQVVYLAAEKALATIRVRLTTRGFDHGIH